MTASEDSEKSGYSRDSDGSRDLECFKGSEKLGDSKDLRDFVDSHDPKGPKDSKDSKN